MPGAPLLLPEREEIYVALIEDPEASWVSIARRIGRHPTTVAREVTGHGGREKYRPAVADRAATRCRQRPRDRLATLPVELRQRIAGDLRLGRSPEAIWADLRAEDAPVAPCTETIYQAVYSGALGVKATDCLRTRRPRRRSRQARHPNKRAGLPNIAGRPKPVDDRAEAGHREIDQIIGARNQSSLLTLTERVTRWAMGITMPEGYDAPATLAGLVEGLDRVPPRAPAVGHLRPGLGVGRVGNPRRDLRHRRLVLRPALAVATRPDREPEPGLALVVPRGIRLDNLDQTHVDHVAAIINSQRRRNLAYQRPTDLYHALTVH